MQAATVAAMARPQRMAISSTSASLRTFIRATLKTRIHSYSVMNTIPRTAAITTIGNRALFSSLSRPLQDQQRRDNTKDGNGSNSIFQDNNTTLEALLSKTHQERHDHTPVTPISATTSRTADASTGGGGAPGPLDGIRVLDLTRVLGMAPILFYFILFYSFSRLEVTSDQPKDTSGCVGVVVMPTGHLFFFFFNRILKKEGRTLLQRVPSFFFFFPCFYLPRFVSDLLSQ